MDGDGDGDGDGDRRDGGGDDESSMAKYLLNIARYTAEDSST